MFEVCRQRLSKLIANKRVQVKIIKQIDGKIIWGNVRYGKVDVALKMIENGWAVYNTDATKFTNYKAASQKAKDAQKGYYASEEEKAQWILEAVPIPYDKNFILWVDTKGVTHNFTCKEIDHTKCKTSFEPTQKQCETCHGYTYWRDRFREEHLDRLKQGIRPLVHGEKRIQDRVKEHIKVDVDEMESIEWYESDRVSLANHEGVFEKNGSIFVVEPYFGVDRKKQSIIFRMRTKYCDLRDSDYDADWIFYERVQFLGLENGARLTVIPGSKKESNVEKLGLVEWADNFIEPDEFENLMKSKTIRVKFYGKFSMEFDLSLEQYQMFEEILYAYKNAVNSEEN